MRCVSAYDKGRRGSESNIAVPEENALLLERKVREGEGRRDHVLRINASIPHLQPPQLSAVSLGNQGPRLVTFWSGPQTPSPNSGCRTEPRGATRREPKLWIYGWLSSHSKRFSWVFASCRLSITEHLKQNNLCLPCLK